MGQPEQFAKQTFAEETERVTGGAAVWQDPRSTPAPVPPHPSLDVFRARARCSSAIQPR